MKKGRYSEEQIIAVLKEHPAGIPVADSCRRRGHHIAPEKPMQNGFVKSLNGRFRDERAPSQPAGGHRLTSRRDGEPSGGAHLRGPKKGSSSKREQSPAMNEGRLVATSITLTGFQLFELNGARKPRRYSMIRSAITSTERGIAIP